MYITEWQPLFFNTQCLVFWEKEFGPWKQIRKGKGQFFETGSRVKGSIGERIWKSSNESWEYPGGTIRKYFSFSLF